MACPGLSFLLFLLLCLFVCFFVSLFVSLFTCVLFDSVSFLIHHWIQSETSILRKILNKDVDVYRPINHARCW